MAIRSEREKSKMQEKYRMILSDMLKEEDNKYCVDCDAKSPRWASWNIGVFICIRCAGFHRNLGVHISKVKSVNLDSWTAEQIASMQAMGNSRARAVYEANLPDGFRRPQANSTLESLIRAKYEQRKWIAKEWIPPEITVPMNLIEGETNHRRIEPKPHSERIEKHSTQLKPIAIPVSTNKPRLPPPVIIPTIENNTEDLLKLDEPSLSSSNNKINSSNLTSTDILDPLHELFTTATILSSQANTNKATENLNEGGMTNEKILALFNMPQPLAASPLSIQPPSNLAFPGFPYTSSQHSQLVPPQKSMSFTNNLYQQATNTGFQTQQVNPYQVYPGINYNNSNSINFSAVVNPTSTFTHSQLNTQLLQFANTRSNTSTATLISNMPTRPVTEYMPASSNSR